MLGHEQERWLARGFGDASARWNIVGQQLLIAELEHTLPGHPDEWYWNDAWDRYPLARRRLLTNVVKSGLTNPVFLTGDWHSTFANDLSWTSRIRLRLRSRPSSSRPRLPLAATGHPTDPTTRR